MTPEGWNFIVMFSAVLVFLIIIAVVTLVPPIKRITKEEQIENEAIKAKYNAMPDLGVNNEAK